MDLGQSDRQTDITTPHDVMGGPTRRGGCAAGGQGGLLGGGCNPQRSDPDMTNSKNLIEHIP